MKKYYLKKINGGYYKRTSFGWVLVSCGGTKFEQDEVSDLLIKMNAETNKYNEMSKATSIRENCYYCFDMGWKIEKA